MLVKIIVPGRHIESKVEKLWVFSFVGIWAFFRHKYLRQKDRVDLPKEIEKKTNVVSSLCAVLMFFPNPW